MEMRKRDIHICVWKGCSGNSFVSRSSSVTDRLEIFQLVSPSSEINVMRSLLDALASSCLSDYCRRNLPPRWAKLSAE